MLKLAGPGRRGGGGRWCFCMVSIVHSESELQNIVFIRCSLKTLGLASVFKATM